MSAASRARRGGGALASTIVPVAAVDDATREAMWQLFSSYYCDSSRDSFVADLEEKHHVILLRRRSDGKLGGFSTLQRLERTVDGRDVIVIYSGDTLVAKEFWGQTALHNAFFRYIVTTKLRHPLRPVYWFLITKGYKTYLLLSRNFPVYWPRHEQPTPAWEAALLDALGREKFGDRWLPERGVLRHEDGSGRLRPGVAPVGEEVVAAGPDIQFFTERNPGHAEGDELCCLGLVDPSMWTYWLRRLAAKKLRGVRQRLGLLGSSTETEAADR